MRSLIRALWYGDIPLVITYWQFGVIANIFFNIIFAYIEHENIGFSTKVGFIFVFILNVFVFIYTVFICVAIWRSANKYEGLQRYAILAKISVLSGAVEVIGVVLEMFGNFR
ncbi:MULTISPECIES: hypothetical protein [Psychrilyobacter]|uniref:Uncharacterized protein n=1 Tax=Psychrilyobacter piezotolerans TaxID=2293438 RepID=A0ABX9KK77_9FUSO|nr:MULTISPECIES: hypothetical protein [Psychrilyobacter]MCS5420555.1 hypothetical protein [Psychrilyobacter sp. S5]NDI76649.1 hypothetical protein [Psychrilyobacter piezotolerans]RDE65275.1 hypothetical protein DV867_01730 [Psychrilyobacter sp. S5]REI42893.1 hypothetical protein DYH56_01730 [Psychrilyobacter piezotolerans]